MAMSSSFPNQIGRGALPVLKHRKKKKLKSKRIRPMLDIKHRKRMPYK